MLGAVAGGGKGTGRARRVGRLVEGTPLSPERIVVSWEAFWRCVWQWRRSLCAPLVIRCCLEPKRSEDSREFGRTLTPNH
jgi:hypothetical protein